MLFDSFKKDSSLGSDRITQKEAWQLGRISWEKQSIASNLFPSLKKWISITHKVIVQLIPSWLCSRLQLLGTLNIISFTRLRPKLYWLGILKMSQPKLVQPNIGLYTLRFYIPHGLWIARLLTRRFRKRRRNNVTRITKGLETTPVLSHSSILIPLMLSAFWVRLTKIWIISSISIMTGKNLSKNFHQPRKETSKD